MDGITKKAAGILPDGNKGRLILCFISTFAFGLVAHAYGLLNNIFSHDSLNAIFADSVENQAKIEVGRFLVPVVRCLRGQLAIPWLIGLIAFTFIALSVYFVTKIFDVRSNFAVFLISGFMVTNVTVTAMTATYVHELDIDMLALLLSVSAAYLWRTREGILRIVLPALLLTLSMAIYQSYAEVAITVMIMVLILDTLDGRKISRVFFDGLEALAATGAGTALYFLLNKAVCLLFKVENMDRVDVTATYAISLPKRIFLMFKSIAIAFISPAGIVPTVVIALINLLIAAGIIVIVINVWVKKRLPVSSCLFTVLLAAMLPAGMNGIAIIDHEGIHELLMFSFWFVYVFAIVLFFRYVIPNEADKKKKAVNTVSLALVLVILWNNILVSNTAYLKKDMEHDVTMAAINRVVSDLEERDDFVPGETKVAFVGFVNGQETQPGFKSVSRIIGLICTTSTGAIKYTEFFNPYINLFKYYFNYPMNVSSEDLRQDPRVKDMPSYPEEGYIQNFDGMLIVKLGPNSKDRSKMSAIEEELIRIKDFFN